MATTYEYTRGNPGETRHCRYYRELVVKGVLPARTIAEAIEEKRAIQLPCQTKPNLADGDSGRSSTMIIIYRKS